MTGHGRVSPVIWSADGLATAFTGCGVSAADNQEQGCGLWRGTGDGSDLQLVRDTSGAEGVEQSRHGTHFSANDSRLLFTRFDRSSSEPFTIWIIDTPREPAARQVVAGQHARWRP